jgi:hypothetical protein
MATGQKEVLLCNVECKTPLGSHHKIIAVQAWRQFTITIFGKKRLRKLPIEKLAINNFATNLNAVTIIEK